MPKIDEPVVQDEQLEETIEQGPEAEAEAPPEEPKPKGKPKNGKKPAKETRPVVYPSQEERDRGIKYVCEMCYGDAAITVGQAKDLLGWTELPAAKGSLLRDRYKKYVACDKNTTNREISWSKVEELVQVQLSKRPDGTPAWEFNGETIIISPYETILNGQKSLISFILADQDREIDVKWAAAKDKSKVLPSRYMGRLAKRWGKTPLTLEKAVMLGISEDDHVVNSLDTAQPRTLRDVMYRSQYFREMEPHLRSAAARASQYAIRLVWSRTGAGDLAFTPYMTHDAACSFLERHPRLLEALKWVATENDATVKVLLPGLDDEGNPRHVNRGKVEVFIEVSRAAALLYLMGMGATDAAAYRAANPPSERVADDALWDKAEDFWAGLMGPDANEFAPVRKALADLHNVAGELGRHVLADEKITVICKAWHLFRQGLPFTPKEIKPKYKVHRDKETGETEKELVVDWEFGGIDVLTQLKREQADAEARDKGDAPPPVDEGDQADTGTPTDDPGDDLGGDPDAAPEELEDGTVVQDNEELIQDPSPEELAAIRNGRQVLDDDESPADERARRERIETQAAAEKEAEKASGGKKGKGGRGRKG